MLITNESLFAVSRGRITGSNIYKYITTKSIKFSDKEAEAIVKSSKIPIVKKDKVDKVNGKCVTISTNKAIAHGQLYEYQAYLDFKETFKNSVVTDGAIFVSKDGIVVSQCDALVDDNPLEIKCPYNKQSMKSWIQQNYFLYMSPPSKKAYIGVETALIRNNNLKHAEVLTCYVDRNHQYYHQAQAHLLCSEKNSCIMMIWFPKDEFITFDITVDENWRKLYNHLANEYRTLVLPALNNHFTCVVYSHKEKPRLMMTTTTTNTT